LAHHLVFSQESTNTKKPLTPEQTLRIYRLSELRFSPDGVSLSLTVTEPAQEDKQNSDIWLYNLKSKHLLRFTTSPKTDRFNAWAQLLASQGFIILCPSIRGSTGYGYSFLIANRYD